LAQMNIAQIQAFLRKRSLTLRFYMTSSGGNFYIGETVWKDFFTLLKLGRIAKLDSGRATQKHL